MARLSFLRTFKPCCDIGGVFLPRFLVQFEIGAQESRSQFRNEFLAAVTFVAPALATEVAVKPLRMLCPVRHKRRGGFRIVDFWQALDLLDIENGIAFHVWDFE